jgi:hypothetical protein
MFNYEEQDYDWSMVSVVNMNEIHVSIENMSLGTCPDIHDGWELDFSCVKKPKSYLDALLKKPAVVETEKSPARNHLAPWSPALIVVNNDTVKKRKADRECVSDVYNQTAEEEDAEIESFYFGSIDAKASGGKRIARGGHKVTPALLEKKLKRIAMKA